MKIMSKILGHINNANETGWFTSSLYGVGIIDDIIDPAGDKSLILPTAIPSPFARIDLVKNAFVKISKSFFVFY